MTMTIRLKLILLALVFAASGLVIALDGAWTLSSVRVGGPIYRQITGSKDLVADSVPPVLNLLEPYLLVLQCLDDSNGASRQERLDRIRELEDAYGKRIAHWQEHLGASETRDLLCVQSHEPAKRFFALVAGGFATASRINDRVTMKKLASGDLRSFYGIHQQAILRVTDLADQEQRRLEAESHDRIRREMWVLGTIAALCAGVSFSLLLQVSRQIDRKLSDSARVLDLVASGDLTGRLPGGGRDEFARLAQAVNQVAAEDARLVGHLRRQSGTLTGQGDELTAAAAAITASAGLTRTRATEANAAAERLVGAVTTVSHAAGGLDQAARDIAASLDESAATVRTAADLARGADRTIAELGQASREIETVATEIATIAGQTNLLALNATIEAASAGDAGRGFAVVANEVKQLARKTAEATKVVAARVQAIQAATRQAVVQVGEVVSAVGRIDQHHHAIAAAVEEQTHTTAGISGDLRTISADGTGIVDAMRSAISAAEEANGTALRISATADGIRESAASLNGTVAGKRIGEPTA